MLNSYIKVALIDITQHIVLGVLSVFPLVLKNPFYLPFAVLFSVFPDIDHVIVAKSFSIRKMLSLGRRPFLHSIPAVLLTSSLIYVLSGNYRFAYMVFITGTTHLVWDLCTGGVRLFYPFKRNFEIPKKWAFSLILFFDIISIIISLK